jgi:hypothetical protein
VADLTPDDLARFVLDDVVTKTAAGALKGRIAINQVRSAVRVFFRYLEETGNLERNPARALRVKYPGRTVPQVLADEEQARLLATMADAGGADGAAGRVRQRPRGRAAVPVGTGWANLGAPGAVPSGTVVRRGWGEAGDAAPAEAPIRDGDVQKEPRSLPGSAGIASPAHPFNH